MVLRPSKQGLTPFAADKGMMLVTPNQNPDQQGAAADTASPAAPAYVRPTPFSKVLIANRGEIARRIIRTARASGYATVAVYSDADARALHVLEADEAVCIGGALPSESYLRIDALLDAARRSGADAIHPGYGFLAENPAFAQACEQAGFVFIGPSSAAIRAMGDKAQAKRLMIAAGVPVVPGFMPDDPCSPGDDASAGRLDWQAEADRVGYPLMIKALAGGGGRGMRLVGSQGDFAAALNSARSEAAHAFGDDRVMLEKAVVRPRHIEIQVFGDRYGQAVHLGERDCSIQRRHQKLLEESPSPAVSAALREQMGQAAVAAVKAIGYEGAGTLEFLLDASGAFYFMEMNTRLQVEHPVTEAITGLDLVAWQLDIAAGKPLPLQQEHIQFSGHAIEVRLCAEDAEQGFLPQSGAMLGWEPSPLVRVDHALIGGADVPPYYDSMIAKVIAWGEDRELARRRLVQGLSQTVALGVTTNQAFLLRCLNHPHFIAGDLSTAFLSDHATTLQPVARSPLTQAFVKQALASVLLRLPLAAQQDGQASGARGLASRMPVSLRLRCGGQTVSLRLTQSQAQCFQVVGGDHAEARCDIEVLRMDPHPSGMGRARVRVDGVDASVAWCLTDRGTEGAGQGIAMHWQGEPFVADDVSLDAALQGGSGSDGKVRASMNGRVVALVAELGQSVKAGDLLLTLEAMKMEHPHRAPIDGVVAAVHAGLGAQVQAGRVLVELRAPTQ